MRIKTIIFDWGGVLDNHSDDFFNFLAIQLETSVEEIRNHTTNYIESFQKGEIEEREIFEKFLKSPLEKSMWKKAVQTTFKNRPAMWELISDLRKKGFKTALLSNTENPTVEHFIEQQYDKYFDTMIFSCHEGITKPSPEIYKIALEKTDSLPKETIFIDDLKENTDAAEKLGMKTVLFTSEQECIDSLNRILKNQNP